MMTEPIPPKVKRVIFRLTHGFIEGHYVNYNSGIKYPLLSYSNIYFVIFINSVFRK